MAAFLAELLGKLGDDNLQCGGGQHLDIGRGERGRGEPDDECGGRQQAASQREVDGVNMGLAFVASPHTR